MAKAVKETFGDKISVEIFTNDSEEAKAYELKSSTTVLVNGEKISLKIGTSREKMEEYLKPLIG